jgi:ABC-type lipoprotein release transport system permease subunit
MLIYLINVLSMMNGMSHEFLSTSTEQSEILDGEREKANRYKLYNKNNGPV